VSLLEICMPLTVYLRACVLSVCLTWLNNGSAKQLIFIAELSITIMEEMSEEKRLVSPTSFSLTGRNLPLLALYHSNKILQTGSPNMHPRSFVYRLCG
jgi:hypothetical protein